MRKRLKGFTLMELMITLGIFGILVLGVGTLTVSIFRYNRTLSNQLDGQRSVSRVVNRLSHELRTASSSSLGAYPIESATATSLVFFANIDDDNLKERVRYFLDGTRIQRGFIKPTGNPLVYVAANEKVDTQVENVTNTDIFTYYDQNFTGSSAALTFPVTTTAITLVKLRVVTDREPLATPTPYEGVTMVHIRNLKQN